MVALRAPACYLSGADAREGGSLSNPPGGGRMNERSERIGQHGGKENLTKMSPAATPREDAKFFFTCNYRELFINYMINS